MRRVNVEWEPVGRAAVGRREGREREEYVMRREGVKIERCKSACGEEGRLNGNGEGREQGVERWHVRGVVNGGKWRAYTEEHRQRVDRHPSLSQQVGQDRILREGFGFMKRQG